MSLSAEQFQAEVDYGTAMLLLREMLEAGAIDAEDFARAERLYAERSQPIFRQS